MTRFCQLVDYYTHILERGERRLKFPKILFLGAKHACKSIISIQTTNYTFFKKSLKIEGFKSFFFLLDKTYDFWTNLRHLDKKRGQERRKGQDRQTDGEEGKERARRKGRARGIYPGEGVGEN